MSSANVTGGDGAVVEGAADGVAETVSATTAVAGVPAVTSRAVTKQVNNRFQWRAGGIFPIANQSGKYLVLDSSTTQPLTFERLEGV
jgi:uncharacterized phosphosugar-binding protein